MMKLVKKWYHQQKHKKSTFKKISKNKKKWKEILYNQKKINLFFLLLTKGIIKKNQNKESGKNKNNSITLKEKYKPNKKEVKLTFLEAEIIKL